MKTFGASLPRLEDRPLLTGCARFAADWSAPNQLHMRVVRSPIAFGRLHNVEISEAAAKPGVVAIWTHDDVANVPPIDFRQMNVAGMAPYRQRILADRFVRYVGEPVAVVFAEDDYGAEDAAETIRIHIEELRPHLDASAELFAFDPDGDTNLSSEPAVIRKSYGDLAGAFSAAYKVVELEVHVGRHTGVPMETRGAFAVYDEAADIIRMFGAAKVPHANRDALARMLELDRDKIHLSEGHVGGGFGVRGELYPEDVIVCLASKRIRRPIKWIEDREEHFVAANHSRDQTYRLKAAVDRQGFILGLDADITTDQGAYVRTHGSTVTDLGAGLLPGPYLVPAYRAAGHVRLTNKTPAGTYRAPGRYESTFARERLIDRIADELALDPIAVRRTNLIPPSAMPFRRGIDALGTELVYDSGVYEDLLDQLLGHVGYDELKVALARRRQLGEHVGLGVAMFVEKSGLGPTDIVRIEVDLAGNIEIVTGVASVGQGVETVLAQICADTLDIPIDRIRVVHGQTDRIDHGMGAFASRVTVMAGSAVMIAAKAMKTRMLEAAATLLQTTSDQLMLRDGGVHANAGSSVSFGALAAHANEAGGLTTDGMFSSSHMNYPYGVHFAQVRLDPISAQVSIERYVVAFDVGRAVNPMLVDGQIVGAAVQGIGGALFEEFRYDANGQPLVTSFADYLMPTMSDVPLVETLMREDAPSPINPLGVKGAGEGGITAVGAALASAIDDALGRPGAISRLPVTPERLHAALQVQ